MTTRSRIRRTLDLGRLRDAIAAPGADPRSWIAVARVDTEPDAVRWETGVGWIADVTISSGELAQEGFIPCRIPSNVGGTGELSSKPIAQGAEVLIGFPDGDPNVSPMILGYLYNGFDLLVPNSVNNQTINEAFAKNTHILVTTKNVDQQVGTYYRTKATVESKLLAQNVYLAEDAATQPYMRGTDFAQSLDTFLTALTVFLAGISTPPGVPLTTDIVQPLATTLITQIQVLQAAKNIYLSTRVRGE